MHRHIKIIIFCLIIFRRFSDSFIYKILHKYNSLVNEDDIYRSFVTAKACECQKNCFYDDECWSFSWMKKKDSYVCSLGRTSSLLSSGQNQIGSGVKRDTSRYVKGSNEPQNFETAVNLCSNIAGYRLGIYKTVMDFEELVEISKSLNWNNVWVNLYIDSSSSKPVWDDGTSFEDTELGLNATKYLLQDNTDVNYKFRLTNFLKLNDHGTTELYNVL